MRVWTHEHTFNHPWETVAQAAWRKYPNPMNPSVFGIDVLRRYTQPATLPPPPSPSTESSSSSASSAHHQQVLITERLISSRWGIPGWASAIIGRPNVCYGYERSVVDPLNRRMTLKSRNISFISNLSVEEEVVYCPHPDHPSSRTLLRQEAIVKCRGVALTDYMEGFVSGVISKNASKGREAMEWVISRINSEVKELARSAERITDGLIHSSTVDELTEQAKKFTDNITTVQAKSATPIIDGATAAPSISSADNSL